MKNTFPHTRSCLICGAPHHGATGAKRSHIFTRRLEGFIIYQRQLSIQMVPLAWQDDEL